MRVTDDLVIFRMKMLEVASVDSKRREQFFETLLRLNAEDMVHGAYGVTDHSVVLTATLRLEHLDFSEFSGTLDDFGLAVSNHHARLLEYRNGDGHPG